MYPSFSVVLIASDDTLVSLEAARNLCKKNAKWNLKLFENARHELLIEKDITVNSVWNEIEIFLKKCEGF